MVELENRPIAESARSVDKTLTALKISKYAGFAAFIISWGSFGLHTMGMREIGSVEDAKNTVVVAMASAFVAGVSGILEQNRKTYRSLK